MPLAKREQEEFYTAKGPLQGIIKAFVYPEKHLNFQAFSNLAPTHCLSAGAKCSVNSGPLVPPIRCLEYPEPKPGLFVPDQTWIPCRSCSIFDVALVSSTTLLHCTFLHFSSTTLVSVATAARSWPFCNIALSFLYYQNMALEEVTRFT